ncbi:MAG: DUF418 domain-containing protein [Pseudomonadota bacterium]
MADIDAGGALDAPRVASSRIDALDALRGLAVLGIFVINIIGFGLPEIAFNNPKAAGGEGAVNFGLWTFTTVFVEGSMRGLFSLMFGAGVVLFTARAAYPDGAIRIADLFYRRTIWLIVFGLAHAFLLLMPGDILLIYGIAGLLLFPFRILSAKKLAALALAFLAGLTLLSLDEELEETELGLQAAAIEERADAGAELSATEEKILAEWEEAYGANWPAQEELEAQIASRTGSPGTVFLSNANIVAMYSSIGDLLWWVTDAFMMMLFGMALYKWRVITAERSLNFYAVMALIGYGIGLGFRIWAVASRWEADFSPMLWAWGAFDQAGRVAMTFGHIGFFFVLWKFAASTLPMRALTAAGRMALTNYISQTVIANLVFTGVGLGLYGAVDRIGIYAMMAAIWLAQLTFSMWWLARFRFGPLEWGWRSLTYWRKQPLRK